MSFGGREETGWPTSYPVAERYLLRSEYYISSRPNMPLPGIEGDDVGTEIRVIHNGGTKGTQAGDACPGSQNVVS